MDNEKRNYELFWLLIGFLLLILMFVGVCNADIKTAPMDNVVQLYGDSKSRVLGTGFIIDSNTLVTAAHVAVLAEKFLLVEYVDGSVERLPVGMIQVSKQYDLAKARLTKRSSRRVRVTYGGTIIGTGIYTVGFPHDYRVKFAASGVMGSNKAEIAYWKGARFIDIPAIGGQSGSPVFNNADMVVGVLVGVHNNLTIIVGQDAMREFLYGN